MFSNGSLSVCVFVCRCLCVCLCGLIRKPFVVVLYDRQRVFAATLLKGLTMANMQLKIKPRNRSPLPHFLSNYCRGVCVRLLLGCTEEIHLEKAIQFHLFAVWNAGYKMAVLM